MTLIKTTSIISHAPLCSLRTTLAHYTLYPRSCQATPERCVPPCAAQAPTRTSETRSPPAGRTARPVSVIEEGLELPLGARARLDNRRAAPQGDVQGDVGGF